MRDVWRQRTVLFGVLLLVATAGCGSRTGGAAEATDAPRAPRTDLYANLEAVPEKLSDDGSTVVVGSPSAPVTLALYEEPRCPACREFETTGAGPEIRDMLLRGKVRIEYTMGSFLDRDGSGGSKRAVNALRAALEKDLFLEYHQILYTLAVPGAPDTFTTEGLLSLAGQVEGLRGKHFDAAVEELTYREFVSASERALGAAPEVEGTPTLLIDGGPVSPEHGSVLYEPDLIELYVDMYVENDGVIVL